jgi:hypothetical protein
MPVQVVISTDDVLVEPGGRASCRAVVHNTGRADDRVTVEVIGRPASWTTVDPPVLWLGADASASVVIWFHPPRAAHVRAGRIPFGVLATSAMELRSTVAEQIVELSRYEHTAIELIAAARRRRSARYWLQVSNLGNDAVRLQLHGRDLDQVMRVDCDPRQLTVFPGSIEYSRVRVRVSRPARRERDTRAFQVIVTSDVTGPAIVTGTAMFR